MERTIRVIGKGKLSVKPDTIRLIMTVEGMSEEYDQAVKESADMTNMLKEMFAKLGFEIDRKIIVAEAAKEVGSYSATIKLHKEVSVKVPFAVVSEAAAE